VTKFTQGAWVAMLAIGLFTLLALRIFRHYDLVAQATTLHPHSIELPSSALGPTLGNGGAQAAAQTQDDESQVESGERTMSR
jgi:hypothetical protein